MNCLYCQLHLDQVYLAHLLICLLEERTVDISGMFFSFLNIFAINS